jgi:hypothetical protein
MRQQKYCILNKQYSKEEYEKLKSEIIAQMKSSGVYGDFFPAHFSCFGYNESCVMEQFPLPKEEALTQGFKWEDTPRGTFNKETKKWEEIPDAIGDINFDPIKEIFACTQCLKNYRIISNEFSFYKRMEIPLPRFCPECRHERKFKARGPNTLFQRSCMCQKEGHNHDSGCSVTFETNYHPSRPEILYCESCYNQSFA